MKYFKLIGVTLMVGFLTFSCKKDNKKNLTSTKETVEIINKDTISTLLNSKDFDTLINGKQVKLYWIQNKHIKVAFTNYGGRIIGLWVPDKNGRMTDVVVGMDNVQAFISSTEPYFGATIGRVGNRIAKGKFTLNGKSYQIPTNNGINALHGGKSGFQDKVWEAEKLNASTLELRYHSLDGEQGFPGNLDVKVTYSVTENNSLRIEYNAVTDAPTVVNLTNHAFFNLNGEGSGSILDHRVQIYAEQFTPVDQTLIPTGEIRAVKNTPFDFTTPHTIGERIEVKNIQLKNGSGYDHNFILSGSQKSGMNHVATIVGDKSKIVMDVTSQEPGVQFYSGNFMEGKNQFKSAVVDSFRTAFALETQHFPDAPNQPNFPSIELNPGEEYHTISVYTFSIKQ
ncbi:aldose epimerase family protein [Galbibacter sp.]|uniref:aldose epimerase family protein n=1 Tax=Galbibacter sp. TaxID=2918471 RepID=UPI003A945A7F